MNDALPINAEGPLAPVKVNNQTDTVAEKNWTQEWLNTYSRTSLAPEGGLANGEEDPGIATRLYTLCLYVLRQICRQEQCKSLSANGISTLKEELGKLYLWGEAFKNGKLDRALEYSDEVRDTVLESLGDIGRILLREVWPSSVSIYNSPSSQESIEELKFLVEQTKAITSCKISRAVGDGGVEDRGSDSDQDGISEDDDTGDIIEELGLHTRWLTQLGPTLEQNLIHAENARLQPSCPIGVTFVVSGPAAIYVSLVREKYRKAENQLVERLGEANWQRHVAVRNQTESSIDVHDTKSVFRPYSAFHDSAIGTTQYARSNNSMQSSNPGVECGSMKVPATPAEVHDSKPFQCFLCKSMLSNIKNRIDWKIHVFSDLQPYICTFPNCGDELAQFSSRAAWAEHEFSKHRITRLWTCPECSQDFPEASDSENHLQERHHLSFSGPRLQVAKTMARKTEATRVEKEECPLCRIVVGEPRRGFVKHVGQHMEEIALMALPQNVEEDAEEGSLSTYHTWFDKSKSFHFKSPIEKDKEEIFSDSEVAPTRAMPKGRVQKYNELTPGDDGYHPATHDQDGESKASLTRGLLECRTFMDLSRPTYVKVHRKHLSPDTLDVYQLPWEWDDRDSNFIIIKQWIPEHDQDILFEHTRKLRETKALKETTVELSSQLQAHEDATLRKTSMDNLDTPRPLGDLVKSHPKNVRGRAVPPGQCHNCGRTETREWRRGPDGAQSLCNACGLRYAKLTRKMDPRVSMKTMEQSQGRLNSWVVKQDFPPISELPGFVLNPFDPILDADPSATSSILCSPDLALNSRRSSDYSDNNLQLPQIHPPRDTDIKLDARASAVPQKSNVDDKTTMVNVQHNHYPSALPRLGHIPDDNGHSSTNTNPSSPSIYFPHWVPPIQHQEEEDLSMKPRCERCIKIRKGCDRQRPCWRCKDAGLGADQCVISEDDGNRTRGPFSGPIKLDDPILDTVAVRRARNTVAARKSRQKRAEKSEHNLKVEDHKNASSVLKDKDFKD